jgi:superfamily II DNA or RNA helicase
MRQWQQQAFQEIQAKLAIGQRDFLAVATPGAGKTRFAIWTAHTALQSGFNRLIVVVPSLKLKEQWSRAATPFKVNLEHNFTNSQGWPRGFHGVVATYAQVGSAPQFFATLCTPNTMVILDEIHHCGEDRSWGKAALEAFSRAGLRLSLSGTPFRHDDSYIPFVNYKNGRSESDYNYSYSQALFDDVCRFVYFPRVGGSAEFFDDGELMARALNADLSIDEESTVLRAVLDFTGKWNEQAFQEANQKLLIVRQGEHKAAKGLILAEDKAAADKWERLVKEITHLAPVKVTSDDENANSKIDNFSKAGPEGPQWIIAIRMVSEGVDIPDLRVAVFASRIKSELFFRQAVGRVVRRMPMLTKPQPAFFYIPEIPTLVNYASSIKEEREHAIEAQRRSGEITREWNAEAGEFVPTEFVVISSQAEMRGVIADGETIEQEKIEEAKPTAQALIMVNQNYTPEEIALILKIHNEVTPAEEVKYENMADRKENLKEQRTRTLYSCAKELARKMEIDYDADKQAVLKGINIFLKEKYNNYQPNELSVEELESQIKLLPQLADQPPDRLVKFIRRELGRAGG